MAADESTAVEVNDADDGRVNVIIVRGDRWMSAELSVRGAELFREMVATTAAASGDAA